MLNTRAVSPESELNFDTSAGSYVCPVRFFLHYKFQGTITELCKVIQTQVYIVMDYKLQQ
jgi:hypothetical protein